LSRTITFDCSASIHADRRRWGPGVRQIHILGHRQNVPTPPEWRDNGGKDFASASAEGSADFALNALSDGLSVHAQLGSISNVRLFGDDIPQIIVNEILRIKGLRHKAFDKNISLLPKNIMDQQPFLGGINISDFGIRQVDGARI